MTYYSWTCLRVMIIMNMLPWHWVDSGSSSWLFSNHFYSVVWLLRDSAVPVLALFNVKRCWTPTPGFTSAPADTCRSSLLTLLYCQSWVLSNTTRWLWKSDIIQFTPDLVEDWKFSRSTLLASQEFCHIPTSLITFWLADTCGVLFAYIVWEIREEMPEKQVY